ncbi:voltage-dependent calcium channel subunit alpha-2/delta-3-like isoform X4 [Ptychodera flava]|uniref:voltage-dependent calcium channel subunit alpha-2/delta-3-like isoform X4 n=1 Tax=Ptychodera flava TaxID=63121 RepID=UPI00396A0610
MLINDWNNQSQRYELHDGLGGEFILIADEHFNDIQVNISESTVQVPTNVYNREETVLRDILFTEELDKVFKLNYDADQTLTWQYFGSYTGFFRNYPGIKWSPDEKKALDLYDCRNRGWYIRAATSPKNMVILVDTSGSMLGLRNDIAKHTVQTLIKTLGDDDFFNVITFNDTTLYLEACFNDTLVQANSDNKNRVQQNLDNIRPQNIANIQNALEKAFELLEKFNTNDKGAGCNQAIMLITDGATDEYESVFAKYNADKHVRLFTYVIGREVDYSEKVRGMACKNKGYFTQIKTIADVQENVSKYIHVLSRPMVINKTHDTVWTNVYMDQAVNEGLALMTTVAQPVFNNKNKTLDQGILLGVVGVDVPVFELLKLTPPYKLGVNGYSFAVTNNGYLLFHPDIRPLYGPDDSLKTNYNSVDLAEVELSDERDELRTAMVNRTTGSLTMEVKLHLSNLQRATTRSHSYYYTDLKDTPFSLGIVLVNDYGQFIIEPNLSLKEGLKSLTEKPITLAAARQWIYCRLGSEEAQVMSKLERIVQYVNATETDDEEYIKKCNPDLIKQVLFDANMTLAVEEYWEAQFDNKESNIRTNGGPTDTTYQISNAEADDKTEMIDQTIGPGNGIVLQFVGTHGGLTRSNYNKMSRTPTDFLEENSNTIQEDYYTRAVELGKGRFLYSVPIVSSDSDIEDNNTLVTASSVVMVQEAAVAVAGIQFRTALLEEIFNNVTESCNGEGCRSCSELDIDCYLLDNSGYVVMSESTSDIGRAFSKIDGIIAADLSKEPDDIYRRIFITDFQAMCENADPGGSSASFLLDPFFSVTAYFKWWTHYFVLSLVQFSFYDWWYSGANAQPITRTHTFSYNPCDKVYTFFDHKPGKQSSNKTSIVSCDGCENECEKSYSVQEIPDSNLLLLVVDATCEFDSNITMFEPRKKEYNETERCERLQKQRHRTRPETCHAYHPLENPEDCGSGCNIQPSLILTITLAVYLACKHLQLFQTQ